MNDTTMPSWTPQTEPPKGSSTTTAEAPASAPRKRTRKPAQQTAPKADTPAAPRKRTAKKKAAKVAAPKPRPAKKSKPAKKAAVKVAAPRAPSIDFATVLGVGSGLKTWQVEALASMLKTLHGVKPKDRPAVLAALKRLG